jgi:hypothetical protein
MRDKEKKHEGHRIIRCPYCKYENKVETSGPEVTLRPMLLCMM